MKKKIKQTIVIFSLPILFLVVFVYNISSSQGFFRGVLIPVVHAEKDDDKYESERDDDNYTSSGASTTTAQDTTTVESKPTYKTVYVTKAVTTLDPIFTTDTDGDGIVDGLDPHLTIPEKDFFTDDDNDGVPNAFDKHLGEDDYAYFEQDNDTNGNGILDSYESLGGN